MFAALLVLALQAPDLTPGEHAVTVATTWVFDGPSRTSIILRKASLGDRFKVVSVENLWARVDLEGGKSGYVKTKSFTTPVPASDSGSMEWVARGQEGQSCGMTCWGFLLADRAGGDERLDQLQLRNPGRDRGRLEKLLLEFRREGRLGEFAPNR